MSYGSLRTMGRLFIILLSSLLSVSQAQAFDDLREAWNVDVLYHYARTERSTLLQTDSFQSRAGGMLQLEYEDQIDLFWRWYVGGDVTFARYEAAASISFSPRDQFPMQIYAGTGWQLGSLKSFEIFLGLGASTEYYFDLIGPNEFDFTNDYSLRGHLGFSWRFLSITGGTAKMTFRYSIPITTPQHGANPLSYSGILDGTMRLRSDYDSLMSLYGGIRFEDYETADKSITYFTARIYAGLGLHFQ